MTATPVERVERDIASAKPASRIPDAWRRFPVVIDSRANTLRFEIAWGDGAVVIGRIVHAVRKDRRSGCLRSNDTEQ